MAKLGDLHRLCAPTDKNGEDPTAPQSPVHLSGLDDQQHGRQLLEAQGADRRPTSSAPTRSTWWHPSCCSRPPRKSLASPAPPPLGAVGVRHFQCYRLNERLGAPATTGIHVERSVHAAVRRLHRSTVDSEGRIASVSRSTRTTRTQSPPPIRRPSCASRRRTIACRFNQFTVFVTNQFWPVQGNARSSTNSASRRRSRSFAANGRRVRILGAGECWRDPAPSTPAT